MTQMLRIITDKKYDFMSSWTKKLRREYEEIS